MTSPPAEYAQALTRFVTGVALVTATWNGRHYAMTANALTSVSLDPVLLLVCFSRSSQTREAVLASNAFGVSILCGELGLDVAERCARSAGALEHQLDGVALHPDPDGPPVLEHCLSHAVCRVEQVFPAGERDAVVGLVEKIALNEQIEESPIVYYDSTYRTLAPAGIG